MMKLLTLALCAVGIHAFAQCPDNGGTSFHRSEKGIQAYKLLGPESYWCMFPAGEFKGATEKGRTAFWLDGCRVEWQLAPLEKLPAKPGAAGSDRLDAFFQYEAGYLKSMAQKGDVQMEGFLDYEPFERKGPDGVARKFKIWTARLGQDADKRPQFWVATTHPRGTVVLSVVQARPEDAAVVKGILDTYLASFGGVDAKSCEILKAERGKAEGAAK